MSGVDSQDPSSADEATMLRDARLARALEHAPDAHLRPDPATRAAVLGAARKAVEPAGQTAPAQGGWRAWLGLNHGGRTRMPWNAAFATILIAGFATLLWRGEPVPEARMDSGPAMRSEAPAAPLSGPNTAAESQPSTAETAKSPTDEQPGVRPAAPARAAKPAPALKAPAAPAPVPAPAPEPAQEAAPSSNAMADRGAEAEAARMTQSTQRESSPARLERHLEGERAKLAQQPGAGAAASALPPPALPAPAAAPQVMESRARAASPAKEASSGSAPSALPADWTHLRRLPDGLAVARAQAGQLPQALGALRTGGDSREAAPAVLERVELQRDGQILGVLELSGQGWRYLPSAPDEAPRSGIMDAAAAARLLGEMERLAPGR